MMKHFFKLITILFLIKIGVESKLFEITEENWEKLLSENEWMVKFYAPWCPACNRFEPVWHEFSEKSELLNINIGHADVNANPVLSGLFSVTSLPTVYHIKNGEYRVYNGNREIDSLVDYIKNKEWQKTEPNSHWLTPNSILIKALSVLFKITLYFKDVYTNLTEKYGLPSWVVLTLFVLVTIALGLFLGVMLILFIDCVCPPKHYSAEELKEMPGDIVEEEEEQKETKKKVSESSSSEKNTKEDEQEIKNVDVKRRKAKKDY